MSDDRMPDFLRDLPAALGDLGHGDPDQPGRVLAADVVRWASREIDRLREENEWTPMLGGHPRNGQNVLACYVDSLGDEDVAELIFFRNHSDWFFVWPDGQAQHGVTHWKAMPIGVREALKRKDAGDAVA